MRTARQLADIRECVIAGALPRARARPVVFESWRRSLAARVDPERGDGPPIAFDRQQTAEIRAGHPLAATLPLLRETLLADDAVHMMIVTDEGGHILWREGHHTLLRPAEDVGLTEGTRWSEDAIGTNAMGTALAEGASVRIHSAEHLVRRYDAWTCAAAPVHDPDTGRIIGVVDLTGPARGFHPSTMALVGAAAKLAEGFLRDQLRARGALIAPVLGAPVASRAAPPDHLVLRFLGRPPVAGLDGRLIRLSARHADMLTLLALRPAGVSAEQLATEVYGERGNPVTARAEIHRLRTRLGPSVLGSGPYRLSAPLDADFLRVRDELRAGRVRRAVAAYTGELLPGSEAPAVVEERELLAATVRRAVLDAGDVEAMWLLAETRAGADDLELAERLAHALPIADPRHAGMAARAAHLARS
ncbi:hypothetical protein BKA01_004567 [Pseudonocardia eucalypti]|uniref:GAF domain-containing protein n=1 Tax=Pseudonocardia eucalypti TaxID=648755 RepID=UPI0017DCB086|nr:hypothetical protein [Pseudonocardia eucalypti]